MGGRDLLHGRGLKSGSCRGWRGWRDLETGFGLKVGRHPGTHCLETGRPGERGCGLEH